MKCSYLSPMAAIISIARPVRAIAAVGLIAVPTAGAVPATVNGASAPAIPIAAAVTAATVATNAPMVADVCRATPSIAGAGVGANRVAIA